MKESATYTFTQGKSYDAERKGISIEYGNYCQADFGAYTQRVHHIGACHIAACVMGACEKSDDQPRRGCTRLRTRQLAMGYDGGRVDESR